MEENWLRDVVWYRKDWRGYYISVGEVQRMGKQLRPDAIN